MKEDTIIKMESTIVTQPSVIFVNGINNERKQWMANSIIETATVPMLQFSSSPSMVDSFLNLKQIFDANGGPRIALKLFQEISNKHRAIEFCHKISTDMDLDSHNNNTSDEEEKQQEEDKEKKPKQEDGSTNAAPMPPPRSSMFSSAHSPFDKWKPVEPEKKKTKSKGIAVDDSEQQIKKRKPTVVDSELELLRGEALNSIKKGEQMLEEVKRLEEEQYGERSNNAPVSSSSMEESDTTSDSAHSKQNVSKSSIESANNRVSSLSSKKKRKKQKSTKKHRKSSFDANNSNDDDDNKKNDDKKHR